MVLISPWAICMMASGLSMSSCRAVAVLRGEMGARELTLVVAGDSLEELIETLDML
jgi:hypothetical protein